MAVTHTCAIVISSNTLQVSYGRTQWAAAAVVHRRGLVKEWPLPLITPELWVHPQTFYLLSLIITFLHLLYLFLFVCSNGILTLDALTFLFYLSNSDFLCKGALWPLSCFPYGLKWQHCFLMQLPMCVSTFVVSSVCSSKAVMWIFIPLLGVCLPFWRDRAFVSTDFIYETCLKIQSCWSQHRFMEKCPLTFSYSIPGGWMYELQMFFHLLGSPCDCSFLYNFVLIALIIAQLVSSYLFSNSQSVINTWTNRFCKQFNFFSFVKMQCNWTHAVLIRTFRPHCRFAFT